MALLSARLNIGRVNAERLHWIGADTVAPTAPLNLAAAAQSATTIALTWQAATDYYGVRLYHIERCSGAGCTTFLPRATATGLTYTDAAEPLHTYRYRIRAEDFVGNLGGSSNIAQATTPERPPPTTIWIVAGGSWTNVSDYARVEAASVSQALNEVPDTATITFKGTIPYPLKGTQISLQDAAGVNYFIGHITAVRTIYEGRARNIAYQCDCIDFTWLLNSRKVSARYTNIEVGNLIINLVQRFAPAGYACSWAYLLTNPVIDEITFTNEELGQAISRACERVGLYWFVGYDKIVYPMQSAAMPSAGTIDDAHPRQSVKLAKHDDYVPIVTRVIARGGGSSAVLDAAVGQTTLPIDDPVWYAAGGGAFECGPQRGSYTGVVGASEQGSTMGKLGAPSANAVAFGAGASGTGQLSAGLYWCAVSSVTNEGETVTTPPVQVTVPLNGNIMFDTVPANAPTDPKVKGFYGYVSLSNQGPETMVRLNFSPELVPWTTDYVLYTNGTQRTTTARPSVSSAGDGSATTPAGSTTLVIEELAPFPASGWALLPGDQVVRYTGKSAASGPGSLTGIPASGIGSITAPVRAGTVKVQPHLTGIPASGAGAIVYPIKGGDQVFIIVVGEDAAAIAALAAATGGDGIREEFLTDGRLALTELTARAGALLAMRKQSLVTVTFETRDPAVTVGKTITFNTTQPPIVGTFLIQRVQISEFQARGSISRPGPKRVVEASSRRYTFDDLVQQIKLLGRIN